MSTGSKQFSMYSCIITPYWDKGKSIVFEIILCTRESSHVSYACLRSQPNKLSNTKHATRETSAHYVWIFHLSTQFQEWWWWTSPQCIVQHVAIYSWRWWLVISNFNGVTHAIYSCERNNSFLKPNETESNFMASKQPHRNLFILQMTLVFLPATALSGCCTVAAQSAQRTRKSYFYNANAIFLIQYCFFFNWCALADTLQLTSLHQFDWPGNSAEESDDEVVFVFTTNCNL